jgi:rhodanese-related sulfurtransferase
MSAAIGADALRAALLGGEEIALLDVREEAAFGPEHILLAVHLPLSRLELRAAWLVPRRSTRIVLCDGGEGLAQRAAGVLENFGYRDIAVWMPATTWWWSTPGRSTSSAS